MKYLGDEMPGKNRINVIVDDKAKKVLVKFQDDKKLPSRDDALEELLHEFIDQEKRIRELEARVKELEIAKVGN